MVALLATEPLLKRRTVINIKAYADVCEVVSRLRSGERVAVDFGYCPEAEAQRAKDFIKGAIEAIGGDVRRFSDSVYFYVGAIE